MAIRICANGHRYDDLRNSECPICARGATGRMDATIGAYGSPLPQDDQPGFELDATIGAYVFSGGNSVPAAPVKANEHVASGFTAGQPTATLPLNFSDSDEGLTISAFNYGQEKEFRPVAGWLVCLEGPEKGRDFRLYAGWNYVGRSPKLQINIADDPKINRDGHFSVVFDPSSVSWFVIPGTGTVTYFEDSILEGATPLKDMAKIKAGDSVFGFRSFCGEEFCW